MSVNSAHQRLSNNSALQASPMDPVLSQPTAGRHQLSGKPHSVVGAADRIGRLSSSPVREILSVANRSDIVSFAGGLPDPESFPDLGLADFNQQNLQYGATEGEQSLREWVAADLSARNLPVSADQVLVLSGSQQGIDLVAKMFVGLGTLVAVESPTYLAALQVFNLFGARYQSFQPDSCADLVNASPALTYSIPTFQNPTGYCYSDVQRQQLAAACDANGSILFEDDPYRDLVYDPCDRQPACSYLERSNWVYQSSFSKTLAPGLRLGYLACSEALFPTLCWLKQAADLHSNRLSQHLVLAQLIKPDSKLRLAEITECYRQKRDAFDLLLQQYFGDIASWTKPAGGLFFWLNLHTAAKIDTRELLKDALDLGVAFMPGEPFYPTDDKPTAHIRLNFSHASLQQSRAGLKILAALIGEKNVGNKNVGNS